MSSDNYRQCILKRTVKDGIETYTSYIPSKYAVLNKTLNIDNVGDGWKVEFVGSSAELSDIDLIRYEQRKVWWALGND
jgi:hypothetical protein